MDIKNLTWLEKPLTKLIETIAELMWTLWNHIFEFDAKKIKRISTAESLAEKEKIIKIAEWEDEKNIILNRAKKRFALEQYEKQVNLENIISNTKDKLEWTEVSDEPVDKDWILKFMNISQDISREDMQDLLSTILSEEIQKPSTVSYRTLDLIKNLTKKELILFKKLSLISSNKGFIFLFDNDYNKWFLSNLLGFKFEEFLELSELWLIQSASILQAWTFYSYSEDLKKNNMVTLKFFNNCDIQFKTKNKDLELNILIFTKIWKEISSLLRKTTEKDNEIVNKYFKELNTFLIENKKVEII